MGKAKRKPRPSMPMHYWLEQDGCWYCKNINNCNQCKTIRKSAKLYPKLNLKHGKGWNKWQEKE